MKLSDGLVEYLEKEGIDTVFGYPGAAVIDLYQSLSKSDIHHVLVRQEQAAVHAASGYARTTGKPGVCIATSGPGATNLITGIATAYMDSIPLIIITGQVRSEFIGRDVFQEVDIKGATEPFVKHSYLINEPKNFLETLQEAFLIAKTGRPGPVLIDIPMDYQSYKVDKKIEDEVHIRGYKPTIEGHIGQIKRAVRVLKRSEKPLICAGGGILLADAKRELETFAEKTHIPVVHTLMGVGAMPTYHSLNKGMIGTHGDESGNWALKNADTVIFIGARMADRAVGDKGILDEKANIIHIDVDPAEIGKIAAATIPVVGDAKNILLKLIEQVPVLETTIWQEQIDINKVPKIYEKREESINPKAFIATLSKHLPDDAVVVADVGQNQFWTVKNMEIKGERQIISSGGFGTMGYSIPAAIGASIANRKRKVVSICGDGSFQMSLFELATIVQEEIAPIIILFNNSGLGMVRELQRRAKVDTYGVMLAKNPDFTKIVGAYGIMSKLIVRHERMESIIQEAIASDKPYFIECIVSQDESTL